MPDLSKDSQAVVAFMTLFSRLKAWSDDDPEGLFDFARDDESVKEICLELSDAAGTLRTHEELSRTSFAAPVDPAFRDAWRDYESRYEEVIKAVWLSDILPQHDWRPSIQGREPNRSWTTADDDAENRAKGIEDAIDFARENIGQAHRWEDRPDFSMRIQEGLWAWDDLKQQTGFDLQGVFRRRALIPFILVPRNIASKHGHTERFSMFRNLQEAHDAFIFGAQLAALALMRSIMETVLKEHYQAEGKDLSERIRSARGRLPPGAAEAALHRLRKLANAVLHLDDKNDQGLRKLDDPGLEREVVSLLFVLRALIEGAR